MRHLRPALAILALAAILVACSGAPGTSTGNQQSQGAESSDGGGGGGGGGGGATATPASSDGGGGGGGGGIFGNGSADYQVTGGITDDADDLAFVPAASVINQNGAYSLSFYSEDSERLLIIILSDDGNTLSWTNSEATMAGTNCDWNVTRKDDNGAEGSFTCNNQPYFTTAAQSGTANISGSFDARK